MNAEIDKLLNESVDFTVALRVLLHNGDLDEFPLALQSLVHALDLRLGKMIELRSDEDEAEPKPKLSPVP